MNRLLGIGEKFPEFSLSTCVSIEQGKEFKTITSNDLRGKWASFSSGLSTLRLCVRLKSPSSTRN